jgi:hypothetical protein
VVTFLTPLDAKKGLNVLTFLFCLKISNEPNKEKKTKTKKKFS